MARTKARYWAGVDGEGVGRDPHRYVYLARVDTMGRSDYVEDERGLPTRACLDFLLDSPTDARVAGYYLGYDWTMILKDLPDKSIYRLLRPESRTLPRDEGSGFSFVRWKDYRLHYLGGMMRIKAGKRSVTVWDLGRFFQAPFVDSLKNWGIGLDVVARIERMKGERENFTELTDEMRRYCLDECHTLAQLAESLEGAHESINLRPKSWHGPGSTAGVALHTMGIGQKRGEIPSGVAAAASYAFFGGRFEHSMLGRAGPAREGAADYTASRDIPPFHTLPGVECEGVHGYDIVSAYPYQAYNLPCLEHGRWEYATEERALRGVTSACVHYRLHDTGRVSWGPLPCRLDTGSIVFARGGFSGWCWLPEWRVAQHWSGLEFLGAWCLYSDCDCRPFARVLPWFRERVLMGKSQRGRVLKLALNSIYGKLAQSVGTPKYGSRVWAGMITSGTRAQLLELLLRHRNAASVLALATDGLYSTERLVLPPGPLEPDLLGSWEHEAHGAMVFVRPGIYWSESEYAKRDAGEIESKDVTLRARGLGRKKLDEQRALVLEAIERRAERAELGTSTVFGGARACVYNPNDVTRSRYYGQWHKIPARINLTPKPKRNEDWSLRMLPGVESAPYSKDKQSHESRELRLMADLFWGSK